MKTLITGVDGFIGGRLGRLLLEQGDEVFGLSRCLEACGAEKIPRVHADLRDAAAVAAALERVKPDRVFHLAALNHIPTSFTEPEMTFNVNLLGTLHILQAVVAHAPEAVVVSVGSSAEYGDASRSHPNLAEGDPLLPTSPYGISKVAQGLLCRQMHRSARVKAIHVRPFAIIGPGKLGDALNQFATQVLGIENGGEPVVRVGNLEPVRDFVDVRDCAAALALLATGEPGATYNLCNGEPVKLIELLEALRGCARSPFEIAEDPAKFRAVEDMRIVGDPGKLRNLGYARKYRLADTVRDTLDALRSQPRE